MELLHNGSSDAASRTRGHFYETVMYISSFNVFQRGDAVLHSVDRDVRISRFVLRHRFEYSARCREEPRPAFFVAVHFVFQFNSFGVKPFGQFFKREDRVNDALIIRSLVFFRNAGTDKYGFCVRVTFFDISAMRLHR